MPSSCAECRISGGRCWKERHIESKAGREGEPPCGSPAILDVHADLVDPVVTKGALRLGGVGHGPEIVVCEAGLERVEVAEVPMAERLEHLQPTNVGQLSVGAESELVIAGHPRQVVGQLPEVLVGLGASEEGRLARAQRALIHSHLPLRGAPTSPADSPGYPGAPEKARSTGVRRSTRSR